MKKRNLMMKSFCMRGLAVIIAFALTAGIPSMITAKAAIPAVEKEITDTATLVKNAKASSEENPANGTYINDGPAAWAFDGTGVHWWHSRYSGTKLEHENDTTKLTTSLDDNRSIWIQTGFDKVKTISKIVYQGRPGLQGVIHDFEIQVANLSDPKAEPNDSEFNKVETSTTEFSNVKTEQTVILTTPTQATHIRLVAKTKFGGEAEIAARAIRIYELTDAVTPEVQIVKPLAGNAPEDVSAKGYSAETSVAPANSISSDVTFSKLERNSGNVADTEVIREKDGRLAFKGCIAASSRSGKFNIEGRKPFVMMFDMKIPASVIPGVEPYTRKYAVIGKMDNQYGVQIELDNGNNNFNVKLLIYCNTTGGGIPWPTLELNLGSLSNIEDKWIPVTAVYDGHSFWLRAGSQIAFTGMTSEYNFPITSNSGNKFTMGCRGDDRPDYDFPGWLSNVKMYVAKDVIAEADVNNRLTSDKVEELVKSLQKNGNLILDVDATTNATLPYTSVTTWKEEGKDSDVSNFEAGKNYTATTVFTATSGTFTEENKPSVIYVDGKAVQLAEGSVTISPDATTMTVTHTLKCESKGVKFDKASLTLGDSIGVNFYLKNQSVDDYDKKLQFAAVGKDSAEYLFSKYIPRPDGSYKFTYKMNAAEMTKPITAKVFGADNAEESTLQYCVKDYADYILSDQYASTELEEKLVTAMLKYGAYSQVEFGKTEYGLADAGIPEENATSYQTDFANVDATAVADATQSGALTSVSVSEVSLLLKSDTMLRFYLNVEDGVDLSRYTATVNGASVDINTDRKYVQVEGIAAKDLDNVYTLVISDGANSKTITYSPLNYVKTVLQNPSVYGNSLVNVVKALYLYNSAANNYFAN